MTRAVKFAGQRQFLVQHRYLKPKMVRCRSLDARMSVE